MSEGEAGAICIDGGEAGAECRKTGAVAGKSKFGWEAVPDGTCGTDDGRWSVVDGTNSS